jgi:hypothetical protein
MDDITANYLNACAAIIQQAINQARSEDEDGARGLVQILRAGGLMRLSTSMAPSTGLAQITIEVVEPSGQSHSLVACDIERAPLSS